jgi:hypothetical protein
MQWPVFINKRIFWDTHLDDINLEQHKEFIITRVFEWGHLDELRALLNYYKREEITAALIDQNYLSKRTLQFASALLNIEKEKFKCYSPIQSPKHAWPI